MSIDNCYENLANAIIIRAAKDYKKAYKRTLRRRRSKEAEDEVAELEEFFRSSYYRTLTNVDGEMLMERLRKECRK